MSSAEKSTHVDMVCTGSVAMITLTRPQQANAYNQGMLATIEHLLTQAEANSQIRAVVFTGQGGRAFCAGADRGEIASRDWRSVLTLRSAAVFERIRRSPKVTMAAINGVAVGGGFELALSCDIRIAVPLARFWLPEPEFGLLPAAAATQLLSKSVGALRAKDLVLGGAQWTASDAYAAGLLSEVAPDNALMECVGKWITRIERRDPDAILLGKQALELSSKGADSTPFDLLAQALLVNLQANRKKEESA